MPPRDYDARMLRCFILFIALFLVSNAFAQETYVLDEKTDTWILTETPEPGTPAAQIASAAQNNLHLEIIKRQ